MKITNVSCTQFAGVRGRSVSFTDGVNVVFGKNESGKSTLVNLISRTLFQEAKLDRRRNKDFYDSFFPAPKKGAKIVGDFADGEVTFETEKGSFTLKKEWGGDPRCTLSTPDGVVRNAADIAEILREELVYGEGVYSDMLLSSQRNSDAALQAILDASKKSEAKREIVDAVSRAFAESGGVSVDSIGRAIRGKIREIAGGHWNFDRNLPARKPGGGRWARDLGEILKAYYALEDAKAVLEEIARREQESDLANADYAEKETAAKIREEEYNNFNAVAGRLEAQNLYKKNISRIENELEKLLDILSKWPVLAENVEKAQYFYKEISNRKIFDLYRSVKALQEELESLQAQAAAMLCPGEEEISRVKNALREVRTLENRLCGMNLQAAIKMFGENSVEVKSLRTGELLDLTDSLNITEAVSVTVPGVMEMVLTPADVDIKEVNRKLGLQRRTIVAAFKKYGVSSLEDLESLRGDYSAIQSEIESKTTKLSALLGDMSYDELQAQAVGINITPRSVDEITKDIIKICPNGDLSHYIISGETTIKSYEAEYGDIQGLKARVFDLQAEFAKTKEAVLSAEDIPDEFANIADPSAHLKKLQSKLKIVQSLREEALKAKATAASRLESYKEQAADPAADVERAQRNFEEQKALLGHWRHIARVFERQKEGISNNPLVDLAANFTRYLGIISGGRVASEFPAADKLNMEIYSSDRLVDYGKLSEGTKETVSLAFRLAVLDHLFPEGGGIAVLDDPFANMDADRTAQSIRLIKDFATRHQVIFLTCKDEYLDSLGGNTITI